MKTMNEPLEPLHIYGACDIEDLSRADLNRLVSVSGRLYARDSNNLTLPALETCDSLDAYGSTGLTLPKLERCRDLIAGESTGLTAPVLVSVSSWLNARLSVGLSLPSLKWSGTIFHEDATGLIISDELARLHGIPDRARAKK